MEAKAKMAGTDPPKNLISLIRDFASEKSQGGNRFLYMYHICFLFVSRENAGQEIRIKLKFPIESNLFPHFFLLLFLRFLCKIIVLFEMFGVETCREKSGRLEEANRRSSIGA